MLSCYHIHHVMMNKFIHHRCKAISKNNSKYQHGKKTKDIKLQLKLRNLVPFTPPIMGVQTPKFSGHPTKIRPQIGSVQALQVQVQP